MDEAGLDGFYIGLVDRDKKVIPCSTPPLFG
jgi:hypothetical protein